MNKGTVATEQHCVPTTFTEDEVLKNHGGLLPEKLGGGVWPASQNPYTIYVSVKSKLQHLPPGHTPGI